MFDALGMILYMILKVIADHETTLRLPVFSPFILLSLVKFVQQLWW